MRQKLVATTATGAEDPSVGIAVKLSATDVDGVDNVKSFTVGTPTNGTFYTDAAMTKPVTGSIDAVNGEATVYFKPNENFNGTANFTYTATDSGNADGSNVLTSTPANGTITVTAVNDAPVATPTTATGSEDSAQGIEVKLSATDVDGRGQREVLHRWHANQRHLLHRRRHDQAGNRLDRRGQRRSHGLLQAERKLQRHRELHLHRDRQRQRWTAATY